MKLSFKRSTSLNIKLTPQPAVQFLHWKSQDCNASAVAILE